MKIQNRPGVYKITCEPTGVVYVGSSISVKNRWREHRWALGAGCHHNAHLQNAWNKYGAESFVFDVIQYVDFAENLRDREQHWLDRHIEKFNIELVISGKEFIANYLARKQIEFKSLEFDEDQPLQYLERYLGLGGVYIAKVMGIAYPTYAAYRSGRRQLPRYHLNQIELITALGEEGADQLSEYIRERINATH